MSALAWMRWGRWSSFISSCSKTGTGLLKKAVHRISPAMPEAEAQPQPSKITALLPVILLIGVQLGSGMRDMPQRAFFLIYLQEHLVLDPVSISSIFSGAQAAGMLTA